MLILNFIQEIKVPVRFFTWLGNAELFSKAFVTQYSDHTEQIAGKCRVYVGMASLGRIRKIAPKIGKWPQQKENWVAELNS